MLGVRFWSTIIFLLLCCTNVRAQQPVLSVYNTDKYVLSDYLYFYEDSTNSLDIKTVASKDFQDKFKPPAAKNLTFGVTRSDLWFKFILRYPAGAPNTEIRKRFYYEVARPHLNVAELFIVDGKGNIKQINSDIRTPLTKRPIAHVYSIFPVSIGLGDQLTLYLHVNNKTGSFLPQTLWTPEGLAAKVSHEEYFYGIFYGGILTILAYNMLLYITSRKSTYLYYFSFVSCTLIFEFTDLGHGFNLFKDQVPIFDKKYIPLFFWMLWIAGTLYAQHFMEIKKNHPGLNIAVNGFHALNLLCLFIAIRYDYLTTIQYVAHYGGVIVMVVLLVALYVRYKGNKSAEFFAYAWSFNMLGFSLYSSVVAGVLPANPAIMYAMPIGTMLEAIVLSLAMADSIKRAEKERIDANENAVKMLSLYRSVFDNAIEGLYQMSLGGRLLSANRAFSRMLGYSNPSRLLDDSNAVTERIFQAQETQIKQLSQVGWLSEQIEIPRGTERALPVLHYSKLVTDADGTPLHIEGKLTDVSERKERERAQRERLKIRREKDVAQRATDSKSEFLKHMSYEIRTPLASIIGFSESLREHILSRQEKAAAITAIVENSHKLLQLINNILDYSKIEANRLLLENITVDVAALLQKLQDELQGLLAHKNLYFNVEIVPPMPAQFFGDPTRLLQILMNLCSNGIQFTDRGGITLTLSWSAEHQKLSFCVQDTGRGIPPTTLKTLRQYLDHRHQTQPPQGLGLSIANRLVQLMGGSLTIDSQPEAGTSVTVSVPAATPTEFSWLTHYMTRKRADSALQDIPQLQGRVLLAEDNVVNQKLIQRVIEKTGASVTIAGDGKKALEVAQASPFDLILMDINMPVMDGLEATRQLRAGNYTRPIYALTAEVESKEIESCLSAGCNGYLSKPLELSAFYGALRKCLVARDVPLAAKGGAA